MGKWTGGMAQGGTGLVCLWGRMKPFVEREPTETFLRVRPPRGLAPTESGRHLPLRPRVGTSTHCLGHVVTLRFHPHGEWGAKYRGSVRGPQLFFQTLEKRKAEQDSSALKWKHLPRLLHMPRAFEPMNPTEVFHLLSWSAPHHLWKIPDLVTSPWSSGRGARGSYSNEILMSSMFPYQPRTYF